MNLGGWNRVYISRDNIIAKETQIHSVPIDDYIPHEYHEDCWCKPVEVDAGIFTHNSLDNRESYEEGRKLQ